MNQTIEQPSGIPGTGSEPTSFEATADPLRRLLRVNGGFSAVTGLIASLGAGPVSDLLGIEWRWLVATTGVGLLVFATTLLLIAGRSAAVLKRVAGPISLADLGWVVGTGAAIGLGLLSSSGAVVMAALAIPVLLLGIGQFAAGRRIIEGR